MGTDQTLPWTTEIKKNYDKNGINAVSEGGGRWGWGKVQLHVSHRRTRISPLAERFEKSRGEDCLGSNTYNYQYQILSSSCISRPQSFLAGEETLALKRL